MVELAPRINTKNFADTFSSTGSAFSNLGRTTNRFANVVQPGVQAAARISRSDISSAPRFTEQLSQVPRFTGNTAQRVNGSLTTRTQGMSARLLTYRPNYSTRMLDPLGIYRNQQAPGNAPGGGTGGTNTGVAALDAHNPELASASARFGVPVNVLKVVLNNESSGDWARDGNRLWNGRPNMGPLLPFVGIFDSVWKSWGCPGDVRSALGNKQAQIDCMAKGLSDWYRRAQAENPSYGWGEVFTMYFSGRYVPIGWADENGLTDYEYRRKAMSLLDQFNQADAGSPVAGGAAGGSVGGAIATIWGGSGTKNLSYGFGAANGSGIPGLYNYAASYGLSGDRHPAVDIGGNIGDPTYSATSGTVVCACSGNGTAADGGGCGAYGDYMGRGCGRIEVKLDNGHTIIYGHMSTATVKVGQRVTAGQQIGTVGGMNGAHVHLEYRIPDRSTATGWRVVDPVAYLGGAASAPQSAPQPQSNITPWLNQNGMVSPGMAPWSSGGGYTPVSNWRY